MAAIGPTVAGPPIQLPALVAHADWGTLERSRRLAVAGLDRGRYVISASEPVGVPRLLLERLERQSGGAGALVGFDFPIGVPRQYAELMDAGDFVALLRELGDGAWHDFFEPAERPDEISPRRPFYPRRPGGTSHEHLIRGLGVESMSDLLRRCDRAHPARRAASPLFWTLGAAQVGRAAISGWRDVLRPAVRRGDGVRVWPFDGALARLVAERPLVVVETYPAETYGHLGVVVRSKRLREVRAAAGASVVQRAHVLGVELTPDARAELTSGCEDDDAFDALVGLVGMLAVVLGRRPTGEPRDDAAVVRVEGWILGQWGGDRYAEAASTRSARRR